MSDGLKQISFTLSFVCIIWITAVYVLIELAMVPYWQTLSGAEIQAWFAEPFARFSFMALIHLLSIITTITAYILHRREAGSPRWLWRIGLVTLLICQGFNFGLYGGNFNPALSSGTLAPEAALALFDDWGFYHTIRTAAVCISALAMMGVLIVSKRSAAT